MGRSSSTFFPLTHHRSLLAFPVSGKYFDMGLLVMIGGERRGVRLVQHPGFGMGSFLEEKHLILVLDAVGLISGSRRIDGLSCFLSCSVRFVYGTGYRDGRLYIYLACIPYTFRGDPAFAGARCFPIQDIFQSVFTCTLVSPLVTIK